MQTVPVTCHPASHVNMAHNHGTVIKTKKLILIQHYQLSNSLCWDSTGFPLMSVLFPDPPVPTSYRWLHSRCGFPKVAQQASGRVQAEARPLPPCTWGYCPPCPTHFDKGQSLSLWDRRHPGPTLPAHPRLFPRLPTLPSCTGAHTHI